MKSIKTILAVIIIAVSIFAVSDIALAGPRFRVVVGAPLIVKPGPNFVWVEGHYKLNRFGILEWVPAHWKRI